MSCFGAGVAVGLVAPDVVNAVSTEMVWDADEHFVREYVEKLSLTPEQADAMRMILVARDQEKIALFKSPEAAQNLHAGLRRQLNDVNERADERIHFILDEQQRKRFAELLDQKGDRWPRP